MGTWKTVIAIALLVIVGGFAYYLSRQPEPEKTPKLYSGITGADIQKIELRSSNRDIVLERTRGGWRITKPLEIPADGATADSIADAIANVQITSTVEEKPSDLAPFGLANPAVIVTATTKQGRALPAIAVGKDTPVGDSSYIKTVGKPSILLVANTFPTEVNKTLDDLRSRIIFAAKPDDVRRIVLDRGSDNTLELDRKGARWMIVKPREIAADDDAVRKMLDAAANAHVADFISDNPADSAKYGLTNPSLTLELFGKKDAQESLLFGFKQPEAGKDAVYAQRGQGNDRPVITVASYVFRSLDKNFRDLRTKTVISFDRPNVQKIILAGGPINETVERAPGGKWQVTSGNKNVPAETPVVESLLDQLHDLKATRIPEEPMEHPERYGMVKPTMTISMYSRDGKDLGALRLSTLSVTVAPKNESQQKPRTQYFGYASTDQGSAVYEVPAAAVRDFENTADRLHSDVTGKKNASPTAGASPAASAS